MCVCLLYVCIHACSLCRRAITVFEDILGTLYLSDQEVLRYNNIYNHSKSWGILMDKI